MHLILTGATGLVGSAVLDSMIKMTDVTKISILSRRPVQMAVDAADPRINVILHSDFTKYDAAVLDQLKDASGCVWALGISQTQVSKEEYVKITKDYALAAAEAFKAIPEASNKPFNFVYVSGMGSTFTPGRFTPIFGRTKGETELALAALRKAHPTFHATTVRPGWVDYGAHKAIAPYIPRAGLATRVFGDYMMGPPVKAFWKGLWSPTEPLGRVLTEMAMGKHDADLKGEAVQTLDGGFSVVENIALRRLAGLDKVGSKSEL